MSDLSEYTRNFDEEGHVAYFNWYDCFMLATDSLQPVDLNLWNVFIWFLPEILEAVSREAVGFGVSPQPAITARLNFKKYESLLINNPLSMDLEELFDPIGELATELKLHHVATTPASRIDESINSAARSNHTMLSKIVAALNPFSRNNKAEPKEPPSSTEDAGKSKSKRVAGLSRPDRPSLAR